MKQYNVTGMSCAACSARVEKAVSRVPGVTSCSVNLLTNSMGVEGTATSEEIIKAVEAAGYGAYDKDEKKSAKPEKITDGETRKLLVRFIISALFLTLLMYFSMGHSMLGLPVPRFLHESRTALGLVQLLLAACVLVINQKFFISGTKAAFHLAPNMDTLVSMGSAAAFIYSTAILFIMSAAEAGGQAERAAELSHEFYFEAAAMILTLVTLGKTLEAYSKGKTTNAIKSLMALAPKTASVITDGKETIVPVEKVKVGDMFAVRPGESIPVDGVVLSGRGAVNESALTGESLPADKWEGSTVSAGTLNQSGYLICRAVRVGEDTTLYGIIKTVEEAAATKAPIAKIADKVSGVFVPTVIAIALVTIAAWLIAGQTVGFALARGISVLVISCPCALGLATPVAIMVGSGLGAKNGILFKNAAALEETCRARVVALDKTGTVTSGTPEVTDLIPAEGVSENLLLGLAYALESRSEHPLARAVTGRAQSEGLAPYDVSDFTAFPGNGLEGTVNGKTVRGGNAGFIKGFADIPESINRTAEKLAGQGKTPLLFAEKNKFLGIIAVADTVKPDSAKTVENLRNAGLRVIMMTGDNARTARAVATEAGIDEVYSDLMPGEKEKLIRELKKQGKVIMVGDGINDAPALTSADIGIAIGAGTDVAIDAADVVLMKNDLSGVSSAINLSRATLRIIRQNLFWAFFYNAICIPVAAGAFVFVTGWALSPMLGAAAMSLSSFCVVTNALRLNLAKIHGAPRRTKIKGKENKNMKKTMIIEGMMCAHCEARVKKALEKVDGVHEAIVSHEKGTAEIALAAPVSDAVLKAAVEEQDYIVKDIKTA